MTYHARQAYEKMASIFLEHRKDKRQYISCYKHLVTTNPCGTPSSTGIHWPGPLPTPALPRHPSNPLEMLP